MEAALGFLMTSLARVTGWDCEETSQVWASCADVTVVAPTKAAN